ncbi:MAG: hypothetical protein AAF518_27200 [Spirochaetota bacterium]
MKLKTLLTICLVSSAMNVSLLADTVTVKKTGEVLENVKTKQDVVKDKKGRDQQALMVESEDGTTRAFKLDAVDVVSKPTEWASDKKAAEEAEKKKAEEAVKAQDKYSPYLFGAWAVIWLAI